MKQQSLLDKYFFVTIGLCIFALAPLLYPGYFQVHTGFVVLWRIVNLKAQLGNGVWLPGFEPFNMWQSGGVLPYYGAALLPLSALTAQKIISGVAILAGASGLYLWLRSWLGAAGASVAALVYTYSPFIIATTTVRGAWSEAFFWGILPYALLAATFVVANTHPLIMGVAALFWLGLGLTQLGLTVWAYLFIVVMLLIFHRPQAARPLISAGLGLGLAILLVFWQSSMANGANYQPLVTNFTGHLLYPAQLIIPFWGYGISQVGWQDGMSFSLGLAALGLTVLSLSIWRGGPDRRPWFFMGTAGVACLLTMSFGKWMWAIPGLAALLKYPWQLLGFAVLGLAVMAGATFWLDKRLQHLPIFATVVIIIILAMYPNLEPQYISTLPESIPLSPQAVYGDNQLLLVAHQFVVANPQESTDLNPVDPYLPLDKTHPLKAGDTVYLQVWWQALTQAEQDYKIFAHLVDTNGQLIDQVDTIPQNGQRPTSTWLAGELIEDIYPFTVPSTASLNNAPPYQVWLGFYNAETLVRLPTIDDFEGRAKLNVY